MSKFKIGSRVRLKEAYHGHPAGSEFTVLAINPIRNYRTGWVDTEGGDEDYIAIFSPSSGAYGHRLELVEQRAPTKLSVKAETIVVKPGVPEVPAVPAIPAVTEKVYTVTLTEHQAEALLLLCGSINGHFDKGIRKAVTGDLYDALNKAGVQRLSGSTAAKELLQGYQISGYPRD